jgi:MFS family permease
MPHVGITSVISLIFEAPPYNFTISQAGLTFFSGLIGAVIGELFAGPVVDYLAKRAINNDEEYVPEVVYRTIWLGLFMMPVCIVKNSLVRPFQVC